MTPSAAVHIYPGSPPHCSTCRPSSPRTYSDDITLAAAHHADGHRQTQCPECGYWRWPWEWPAPESRPTGMRWRREPDDSCADRWLLRRRYARGWIVLGAIERRSDGGYHWAYWWRRRRAGDRATLADCARALVAACGVRS